MLVYTADKRQFLQHARSSEIDDHIIDAMRKKGLGNVSPAELASWRNSMKYMMAVLMEKTIPDDTGVAIEYNIPQTSKRIDFILTGRNSDDENTAIIIELKQWSKVSETDKDGIVETFVGRAKREMLHPSYQAWSYAALLEDFNESIETDQITLRPCAYLHNCTTDSIHSSVYREHLEKAPAFLKCETDKLTRFIQQHVRKGDRDKILYRIENGRIRPSKSLSEYMASLLEGNRDFLMIDDQKLVYETALQLAELAQTNEKQVLLVEGGPGTGKSVVAVNLLVEMMQHGRMAQYVTRNSAPRVVYRSKLTGSITKSRIDNIFRSSGSYHSVEPNTFDALIVDEAHRLNDKSGMYSNLGENQIKELIEAARLTVFFLDEDQRVTWKDIGSCEEVKHWARQAGATLHHATLRSQFRCSGSDGYLAWLDHALQIRKTSNTDASDLGYSISVVDSPIELRDRIFKHNIDANRARLLAGYTWDWLSKKNPDQKDIEFPEHGFSMRWNLNKDGMLWLIQPNSVHEIGCIHTCQGLELDYVGVIIGPDLIVRDGRIITQPTERSKMDSSIKGYKKAHKSDPDAADDKAESIIKNTYRTLLSRGMKGCYIWCTDEETNEYFKSLLGATNKEAPADQGADADALPLEIVPSEKVVPFTNAVPLVNFKVAAGDFSDHQSINDWDWVALPDYLRPATGMFVAQVIGESMNRRIPNGAWCLFQRPPGGTRQGKIVLVQHRDIQDPDTGVSFTVKRYYSEKSSDPDTEWQHLKIELRPDSSDPDYQSIVLESESAADLRVIGEFKAVIDE